LVGSQSDSRGHPVPLILVIDSGKIRKVAIVQLSSLRL
jgi:hypothetical protein